MLPIIFTVVIIIFSLAGRYLSSRIRKCQDLFLQTIYRLSSLWTSNRHKARDMMYENNNNSLFTSNSATVTTVSGIKRTPVMETRLLVIGLTGSGKSSMLKALLSRNFDASSSGASSSKMLFTPYQSLIELATLPPEENTNRTNVSDNSVRENQPLGVKFIIKACDTRGLNDPDYKDEDTFEAIQSLYSSEFNLINHIFVCFKLDRIRADVHTSIVNLMNYLKRSGFQSENISIALTFCDGYRQEQIDTYVQEMKEHPIVGELFRSACKTFIVTLPDLLKLDDPFRQAFEGIRDQIIDNLVNHLAIHVNPIQIISHQDFETIVRKKAQQLTTEEMKKHKHEIDQLKAELVKTSEEYEKVCGIIRLNTQQGIEQNMKQLKKEKQELHKQVQDLQRQCAAKNNTCVIS